MGQRISDLNQSEQTWVVGNIELAHEIAKAYGLDIAEGAHLNPSELDAAWAAWLAGHDRTNEDPNPFINAFGLAFGAHLVDRLGLEWKVIQDDLGTEMAVWGREGEVTIFPANLVGKRYVAGTTRFFDDVAAQTEDRVREVRAELGGTRQSGLRGLFHRDR